MHFRFLTNSKTLEKMSSEHIKLLKFLKQKNLPSNIVQWQITSGIFKEWIWSTFLVSLVDFYCFHDKTVYKHKIHIQFCRKSKSFAVIYIVRFTWTVCRKQVLMGTQICRWMHTLVHFYFLLDPNFSLPQWNHCNNSAVRQDLITKQGQYLQPFDFKFLQSEHICQL